MSSKPIFHASFVCRFAWQAARVSVVLVLLFGMLFVPARTAHAGPAITMTVNTTSDTVDVNPGNGVCADSLGYCSLRAAVMEANADPGSTIQFAASLNGTPIVLTRTGNDYNANSGDLDINANMTITGNGSSNTIIQAAADASYTGSIQDKVFGVNQYGTYNNLTVHFSGLTIRYGDNNILTSDPDYAYTGGGVDVYFTGSGNSTTFTDCVISYNRSRTSYGGGLNVDSNATGTNTLTLTNVTFSNNSTMSTVSTSSGGALNVYGNNVTVTISNSTFTTNTVPTGTSYGGAINFRPNSGSMTIDRTVFSGNSAWYGGAIFADAQPVTITYSRIVGNTASGSGIYVDGSTVTAENNWWGCSTGPSAAPCDTAVLLSGTLDYTHWLRDLLTSSPDPLTLATNQSATLTASFLTNSAGGTVAAADLTMLIGRSVTWAASFGTLSGQQTTIQSSGTATATFKAISAGSTVISAKVDNDSTITGSNVLSRSVTISKADTTTAITTDLPDPSTPGQSVTVGYTVTGAYGNTPIAPTGNVTVSDGIDTCIGTVAAGSCNITLTTAGVRTLTATYVGNANFNLSVSSGASHTVNQAPSITSLNNTTLTVGSAGTFTVTTAGFPTGASMTISETGSLPGGVTFTDNHDGTATLAGTPGAGTGGTYIITITASNGIGTDATQTLTLTIKQSPAITSANMITFTETLAGSFMVTTSGFPTGASMIISKTGALPSGVTFSDMNNGTATLAGTPALGTNGNYPITIMANNGIAPNVTQNFTLVVQPNLQITSANNTTFTVGSAGSFNVTTVGTPIPTLSASSGLPSSVTFTDNGNGTATLASTPVLGENGNYPITITAHNGVAPDATQSFTLTVNRSNTTIVSIDRIGSALTNASSVSWTVTFANATLGLTSGNFTLVNGSLGGTPTITAVTPDTALPATAWTVTASTGTGDGTLGLNLVNDTGLAHNLTNAPFTGEVYTLDRTAPTVTINQAIGQSDPAGSSPINFTVVFSEPVTDFATGDVTLSASTAPGTLVGTVSGGPTTYSVAVSGMTGDGMVIATIAANKAQDIAGNNNAASTSSDNSVLYDTIPPSVTINQAVGQSDPTNVGPIHYTVVFNEAVTGFAIGDVTLGSPFGGLSQTVTEIAPMDGTTYDVSVTGMSGSGTIVATINSGVAFDLASHPNTASTSTDNTVTYDDIAPNTSINSNPTNPTNSASASFSFTGSDSGGSGVAGFECQLDGAGFSACTSPKSYSNLSAGSHTFDVRAVDMAGNRDATPASYTWAVKADTTINLTSSPNPSGLGQSVTFTATVTTVPPSVAVPSGVLTFTINGSTIVQALDAGGVATYVTDSLSLGVYSVTADYGGTINFNPSSGTLSGGQVVTDTSITDLRVINSSPNVVGNPTVLTATASGDNIVYTWNLGDGSAISSGSVVTHTYGRSGAYTAVVTASNGGGVVTATTSVVINPMRLFMPFVMRNYASAPDLVVERIIATRNNIQVVIKNQGDAPVMNEF